jgi:hypothetical protein
MSGQCVVVAFTRSSRTTKTHSNQSIIESGSIGIIETKTYKINTYRLRTTKTAQASNPKQQSLAFQISPSCMPKTNSARLRSAPQPTTYCKIVQQRRLQEMKVVHQPSDVGTATHVIHDSERSSPILCRSLHILQHCVEVREALASLIMHVTDKSLLKHAINSILMQPLGEGRQLKSTASHSTLN